MSKKLVENSMLHDEDSLQFNAQASLDFTFLGTGMQMAFVHFEGKNAFVILPTDVSSEGMSIEEMVAAVNKLAKDYDPTIQSDLDKTKVEKTLSDVSGAAAKKQGNNAPLTTIDFSKIKIRLRQAFLLLQTGEAMEYALEIDVDLNGVFPTQTFITVSKLSLSIWNTKRVQILNMMDIIDVEKLLENKA